MAVETGQLEKHLEKYQRLIQLGQEAYRRGESQRAHRLWRQAAMIQSDDETLWQLLLSVVTATDDRIICLTNILTLNPDNHLAEKMLRAILHGEVRHVDSLNAQDEAEIVSD